MTVADPQAVGAIPADPAPGETAVGFARVRSSRNGRLFGHAAVVTRRARDGTLQTGPGFAGDGSDGRSSDVARLIRFTRRILDETAAFASDGPGRTETGKLIVPVPIMALALKEPASAFTELCRRHAATFAGRLAVEMACLPAGANLGLLDDAAVILYAYSPFYLVRLPVTWRDFKAFANANVHCASVDLSDSDREGLAQWMDGAKRWRLAALAHGVDTPDATTTANTLGFDYLSGKAV
jgi:hypothetical protein